MLGCGFYVSGYMQSGRHVRRTGVASWQKGGSSRSGPRASQPVLSPSRPFSVLQTGKRVGKVLHASLQSVLHKEESLGPKRQRVGFLG